MGGQDLASPVTSASDCCLRNVNADIPVLVTTAASLVLAFDGLRLELRLGMGPLRGTGSGLGRNSALTVSGAVASRPRTTEKVAMGWTGKSRQ